MKKNLLLCFLLFNAITIFSQSNHTVTFSGNSSDFSASEKQWAGSDVDYYVTYDANNLYIGAFRVNSNTFGTDDNLAIYIDSDPDCTSPTGGTGTTTGQTYNNVTGTLPFSANYDVHAEQNYQEAKSFGSGWSATISGVTYYTSGTCREVKIPLSSIGNPTGIYFTLWMGYNGGTFAPFPTGNPTGNNPACTHYVGYIKFATTGVNPLYITDTKISCATKYYKSNGDVTWTAATNWLVSTDDVTYAPASTGPSAGDAIKVTVQSGNTLAVSTAAISPVSSNFIVNGTLQLNSGGYVTTAPTYGTSSTLKYATDYTRNNEWSLNATANPGYPNNVVVTNNSTLTINLNNIASATSVSEALYMGGNLTIDNGSTLSFNSGVDIHSNIYGYTSLTVVGNINTNGTLKMTDFSHLAIQCNNYTNTGSTILSSNGKGGDLRVKGDYLNNGANASSVNVNGRAIVFNGSTNNQILGGSAAGPYYIDYLVVDKSSGIVTVQKDIICDGEGSNHGNSASGGGSITVMGGILDLSGVTATVSLNNNDPKYFSSIFCGTNGSIRTNSGTTLNIFGSEASNTYVGNVAFDQTTPGTTNVIGTFNLNRVSGNLNCSTNFIVTNKLQIAQGKLKSSADILLESTAVGTLSSSISSSALEVKDLIFAKSTNTMQSAEFYKNGKNLTINGKVRALIHFDQTAKWHFVSFPFAVASVKKSDGTSAATLGTDYSLGWYDPTQRALNISGWKSSTDNPMTAGKGYIINKKSPLEDLYFDSSVQGNDPMFNTTASKAVTYTPSSICNCDAGWNFIAHPMSAKATPTLAGGEFAYSYNPAADAYKLYYGGPYNPGYSYTGGVGIKPFDAFFVKTPSAGNVSFSLSSPQGVKRREVASAETESVISLNLNSNNIAYETLVRVMPDATTGQDEMYDAPYNTPMSAATPRLYTLIEGVQYALNSVPEQSTVVVGLRIPAAGSYNFTWESPFDGTQATLTDTQTGAVTDMTSNSSYNFESTESGDINTRFVINILKRVPTSIDVEKGDIPYRIYSKNNQIFVEGTMSSGKISLFSADGKLVQSIEQKNSSLTTFNIQAKGVYILNISDNTGNYRVKVINR